MSNLEFLSGSHEISKGSYDALDDLAEYLLRKKNIKLEIGGHTDDVGSDESNLSLSQRRAQAVVNYLVKKGIGSDRLKAKGYGETQPVADNSTAEGRQRNRRTELLILAK